eukprot:symbB.v1.2.019057.t1/scaffold1539.1/size115239/6
MPKTGCVSEARRRGSWGLPVAPEVIFYTKLKAFQSDLQTHTKRLNELKKSTAERKKAVTMREAEHEVKKVT